MEKKVGVAVIIIRNDKVLLGKRCGKRGNNLWAVPGGAVEENEEIWESASREVKEETNLDILSLVSAGEKEDNFPELNEKWLTIYFLGTINSNVEPVVVEPNKCLEWRWFDKNELQLISDLIWPGTEEIINKFLN